MNYANVFGRTQKQFDMTMNREKITVTDFFNSDTKYDVFFRRNQRSTTPQGKVRFFYAQSTPIDIGTIFVLNGSNFIVTSKDGIESKTVIKFHNTFLLGHPTALSCNDEHTLNTFNDIYVMNLDVGDFKYANCSLDYNSIKLYLDNMKQFLNDVACMPSVLGSSTNIANISEVSMQILLMMASVYADENKKWLNIGFQKRFEMFKKILGMQGIKVDSDVEIGRAHV